MSLFRIAPKEVLPFELSGKIDCRAVLNVSNESATPMAFKVKTTQPDWYVVRPNQDVIPPGESLSFEVSLINDVKNRLLFNHENGQSEDMSMHRFLVQGTAIAADTYDAVKNCTGDEKAVQLASVWKNAPKETGTSNEPPPREVSQMQLITNAIDIGDLCNHLLTLFLPHLFFCTHKHIPHEHIPHKHIPQQGRTTAVKG